MERRDFLKLTFGFVAAGAALAATAQAAPLPPISSPQLPGAAVEPAVVSQDDVDRIKPEEVRWHRHHHWHRRWHHRWHHRRWHRRHRWHRHHRRW